MEKVNEMNPPNKQINNIYGYVRVSTTEQAMNGISLDTQKDLINEFVKIVRLPTFLWRLVCLEPYPLLTGRLLGS